MSFLKKIGIMMYMLIMLSVGVLFLSISIPFLPQEVLQKAIGAIYGSLNLQAGFGIAGSVFVVIGVISPFRMLKKLDKKRMIAFQNPDGEVTVSLAAIEDYVRKITKDVPGVKDLKSKVGMNKKGINVVTTISMSGGSNIPEMTESMQTMLKSGIQNMLGVETRINVKLHINKIVKGGRMSPEGQAEAAESDRSMRFPFPEAE